MQRKNFPAKVQQMALQIEKIHAEILIKKIMFESQYDEIFKEVQNNQSG